jgi:hypothetical protein
MVMSARFVEADDAFVYNVFHKRVATPSEWPPQQHQRDCAATAIYHNTQ